MSKDHALDLKFAYGVEEAYLSLGQLSLEERALYRFGIWALDMPYMVVYSLLIAGLLYRIRGDFKLTYLPLLILIADFIENLAVLRILKLFPSENEFWVLFASVFTTSKWILVGVTFSTILFEVFRKISSKRPELVDSPQVKI